MNTHDKIVRCRSCGYVGPCDPTCCEHPDYDGATAEEAWQAAIEAERIRILNCVKKEFHNALSKYKDSRNNYWDGAADAFCTAEQIVKGEN